jgi:ferredoxin, 2Fe-2S
MPQIIVLPHEELCPEGAAFEAKPGMSICDNMLEHHIDIDHACEKACACTTCHVVVREGYQSLNAPEEKEEDLLDQSLNAPEEKEEDLLDKAWGLEPTSRLSCQAIVHTADLVVEIPKYSINMAKEGHR